MRTALRTAAVLALAVPVIAAAVPASASSTYTSRESGSYADVYFQGSGTPGGVEGNYSVAGLTFQGDFSYGWVDTFQCDPGETPGGGDEVGDCDYLASYDAQVTDLTVLIGKGNDAASTYSGTVDLYQYTDDQGPAEPTVQDVPFEATLTPMGGTMRSTFTNTYRDHEAGVSYRFRESTVTREAAVEGDFDGVPAVFGTVGTFRRSDTTRIA
jgi:hypothetical protein